MPVVQVRNAEAALLGSTDHLFFDDRNFCAEFYDHAGGQTFILGNSPVLVNLDTVKVNVAPTEITLASDIITLVEAGLYLFRFQVMVIHNGSSSATVNRCWLEEDPATGVFAMTLPAVNYFTMAPIINSVGTGCGFALRMTQANYRYRIMVDQQYGSGSEKTVADGSSLSIVRLFKTS